MYKEHWKSDMSLQDYEEARHNVIVTESGSCPGLALLRMLQGKWKYSLLYAMGMEEPRRFSDLRQLLPEITNTMLTSSLRELEADGLVSRVQLNEIPPHVEYSLTEKGRDLLPVFYEMTRWGLKHIP